MDPAHPVVMKFGGTSVQDAAALRRLIEAVGAEPRPRIVVVSALAGVTDALVELADGRVRGSAAGESMHRLLERHIAVVRELVAPQRQRALIDRLAHRFEGIAKTIARARSSGREATARAVLGASTLAESSMPSAKVALACVATPADAESARSCRGARFGIWIKAALTSMKPAARAAPEAPRGASRSLTAPPSPPPPPSPTPAPSPPPS